MRISTISCRTANRMVLKSVPAHQYCTTTRSETLDSAVFMCPAPVGAQHCSGRRAGSFWLAWGHPCSLRQLAHGATASFFQLLTPGYPLHALPFRPRQIIAAEKCRCDKGRLYAFTQSCSLMDDTAPGEVTTPWTLEEPTDAV
jgi:hypothetical protein